MGKREAISVTAEWIFSEHGTKLKKKRKKCEFSQSHSEMNRGERNVRTDEQNAESPPLYLSCLNS